MIERAKNNGLGSCPRCQKVNVMHNNRQHCSRCNHWFYSRKPNSLQHTMAWTIAALIMFIPANNYPMMVYYTLGKPEASTILEGIAIFIHMELYPVAFIIFIASFIIPLGKIFALIMLMLSVAQRSTVNLKQQSKLFHLVEYLGPWSMLDVFVVVVMAAVVNLGFITNIDVAPGATYFALMVIFTMFAASSFDPRLLWDNNNNGPLDER